MVCIECTRGFHSECGEPCCCANPTGPSIELPTLSEVVKLGRPPKPDEEISESAGRKRAAELYNLEMGDDKLCEWLGYANCGGGFVPILGCLRGRRTDIHHGPDKRTFVNERTNINLICSLCHNRWHAINDPKYGKNKCPEGILPKKLRPMTKEEFVQAISNETNRKE